MESNNFYQTWGKILAQTWTDDSYRSKVEANPAAALKAHGVQVPDGVNITVKPVDAAKQSSILVLPFPESPDSSSGQSHAEMLTTSSCSSSSAVSCCCP